MKLKNVKKQIIRCSKFLIRNWSMSLQIMALICLMVVAAIYGSAHTRKTVAITHSQPAAVTKTTTTKPKPSAVAPPPPVKPSSAVVAKPKPQTSSQAPRIVTSAPQSPVKSLNPTPAASGSSQSNQGGTGSNSSGSNNTPPVQQPVITYTSSNWSGYLAAFTTYTAVSGSWMVPSPTGTSGVESADAAWIGIGGVTSGDLIQIGTEDTVEPNGQVEISAFYEMLPAAAQNIVTLTVSPGDSISASVSETSTNLWTLNITDNTTGQSFSKTVSYSSSLSSAEWIEEDPSYMSGNLVPLDNFGSVHFSGGYATAAGSSLSLSGNNAQGVEMVDQNGQPEAVPSAISGGSSFSVTWQ